MPRPLHIGAPASVLALLTMCVGIAPAQDARPGRGEPPPATTRLIAVSAARDGVWTLGVSIVLRPGFITYWRNPGEAGVPPRFDFTGSANVARADVSYPAPRRLQEAGMEAIGYEGAVVFPVRVVPAQAGAPVTVSLRLDYAVCERICLPARADLSLTLPPPPDAVDAAALARAEAAVPRVLDAQAAREVASVTRIGDKPPSWVVRPDAAFGARDLFADGPDGFYLSSKSEGDGFRVAVEEHPPGRDAPDRLSLTMVGAGGAVEFDAFAR